MRVALLTGMVAALCIAATAAGDDNEITSYFQNLLLDKEFRLRIDVLCADDIKFGERENHTFFDTEGPYYMASYNSSGASANNRMLTVREWSAEDLINRLRREYPLFEDKRYLTLAAGEEVTVSVVYWDGNSGSLTVGFSSDEGTNFIYFEFGEFWSELGMEGMRSYIEQAFEE